MVLEMPPSGGIIPSAHCYTMKLMKYIKPFDYFILGFQLFLVILLMFYACKVAREICFYQLKYFLHLWCIYDIVFVLMACVTINFWIACHVGLETELKNFINFSKKLPGYAPNLDSLSQKAVCYSACLAVFLLLTFLKIFKFLSICTTFSFINSSMKECSIKLVSQMFMVVMLFTFFAILGTMVFGKQVEEFSSLGWSFLTLFIMLHGIFPYEKLLAANFIMGPIFIYLLVILLHFVFMNIFIAIIVYAYSSTMFYKKQCKKLHLGEALQRLYIQTRCNPCTTKFCIGRCGSVTCQRPSCHYISFPCQDLQFTFSNSYNKIIDKIDEFEKLTYHIHEEMDTLLRKVVNEN